MANVLKMEKQTLITELLALGWSYRRIEKETGIRRETVAKYDSERTGTAPKPAKVPTDSSEPESAAQAQKRPKCPPTPKPTRVSQAQAFEAIIKAKLDQQLTAQRIYQDLVVEQDYAGSYDSIKRYVRKLKANTPKLVAHLHAAPGEEAQVDFGKAAPTLKNGRYLRPWFFKMVLSYSRHSYEEVVWTQDVETFVRCHERAFAALGGVPGLVRLDNLKSGVLKAKLYDPVLNPIYEAFAKHAGFVPLPCLPRKPEHKGKVESGVGYTKDNALKDRKFESLEAQNVHLRHWNKRWARTRIHGTTKKQVWALFSQVEQQTLRPYPLKTFAFFKIGTRKVQPDGHIEVARAYYSVPHKYLGQGVVVHFNAQWVKVLSGPEVIAFHRTGTSGRFSTDKQHLPENKCLTTEEYKQRLLKRCRGIGEDCHQWAAASLEQRNQLAFRAIQGVIRLRKKYATEIINQACSQALKLASTRYHTVALLCQDTEHQVATSQQLSLLQEHDLIRPPEDYQDYFENNKA